MHLEDTIVVPVEIEISLRIFGRIGTELKVQFHHVFLGQICHLAREYHVEFAVVLGFCIGIVDVCQHLGAFFRFAFCSDGERCPGVVVGRGAGIIINLQTTHEGSALRHEAETRFATEFHTLVRRIFPTVEAREFVFHDAPGFALVERLVAGAVVELVAAFRVALSLHVEGRFALCCFGSGPREIAIAIHLQPSAGLVHQRIQAVATRLEGTYLITVGRCHGPPVGVGVVVACLPSHHEVSAAFAVEPHGRFGAVAIVGHVGRRERPSASRLRFGIGSHEISHGHIGSCDCCFSSLSSGNGRGEIAMCGSVLHVIHVLLSLHRDKLPELSARVVFRGDSQTVFVGLGDENLFVGCRLDAINQFCG